MHPGCESGQLADCNNENHIVPVECKPGITNVSAAINIHLPSVSIDIHTYLNYLLLYIPANGFK